VRHGFVTEEKATERTPWGVACCMPVRLGSKSHTIWHSCAVNWRIFALDRPTLGR